MEWYCGAQSYLPEDSEGWGELLTCLEICSVTCRTCETANLTIEILSSVRLHLKVLAITCFDTFAGCRVNRSTGGQLV